MPLITVPGNIQISSQFPELANASFSGVALDGTSVKRGNVFIVPKSGTLETFEFHTHSVTTGNDLKISFQDVVPTTGAPDEIVDQFRVVTGYAANSWIVPGKITSDGTDAGTPRTVTAGDLLAVVIEWNGAAGSIQLKAWAGLPSIDHPYGVTKTTSWSKHLNFLVGALKYTDGSYVPLSFAGFPIVLGSAIIFPTFVFNSGSSPDEHGLRFSFPFRCKLNGFTWWCGPNSGAADVTFKLYDNADTVLWSRNFDADQFRANVEGFITVFFSPIDIIPNAIYRLTVVANNTLANFTVRYLEVPTNAHLGAFPGGTTTYGTTRTDAGAWTDITTRRYFLGFIISDIDNGVGTSGGGERSFVF